MEEIHNKRVNPDQRLRMSRGLAEVKARYIVETEQWKTNPVTEKSPASEPIATGISPVKLGNISLAEQAEARLGLFGEKEQGEDRTPGTMQIMHGVVAAQVHLAKGNKAKAVALLEVGVKMAEGPRQSGEAGSRVLWRSVTLHGAVGTVYHPLREIPVENAGPSPIPSGPGPSIRKDR